MIKVALDGETCPYPYLDAFADMRPRGRNSMKAWITFWAIVLCAAMMTQQALGADDSAGVRRIAAPSKERGTDLEVTVWYPAQPGGEPVTVILYQLA